MGLLTFLGLASVTKEVIKEKTEFTIPSDNWKNVAKTWDIFNLDAKEFQKNLRNGKYK